jgi:hypothetical protein
MASNAHDQQPATVRAAAVLRSSRMSLRFCGGLGLRHRDLEFGEVHARLEQEQLVLGAARLLPRRKAEDGMVLE